MRKNIYYLFFQALFFLNPTGADNVFLFLSPQHMHFSADVTGSSVPAVR